jgi:hypothetical protein
MDCMLLRGGELFHFETSLAINEHQHKSIVIVTFICKLIRIDEY